MESLSHLGASLGAGLVELGLPAEPLTGRLLDYLALLDRWNRTYNLTAVRDPAEMVGRHLLDSLSMWRHVQPGPLADLGTGPGLPGIPLALALPSLQVVLVESNGKKTRFLREVARRLALPNVEVVESRAESYDAPGRFAQITARAMDTLAGILGVGGHLLADDGRLLAMKGQRPDAEIAALPPGWRVDSIVALQVPGVDGERHLVAVTRDRPQAA